MIGVPTIADAVLDRVIHNAYRIELAASRNISLDLRRRDAGGRLQIGTPAGFILECMAGFVGIRTAKARCQI